MKISTVLTSSTLDLMYIDFIPNFINHWKFLFPKIDIKIILIANHIPDSHVQYKDNIILFNHIPNISPAFQAMCIRLLYPALMNVSGGVLITDIDMMPMNRKYYTNSIKDFDNSKFVTYRDILVNKKQYAMCYSVATPTVWSAIFNIKSIDNIITTLKDWYSKNNYMKNGINNYDQRILYDKTQEFNKETGNLIVLNDNITGYYRLDRLSTNFKSHVYIGNLFDGNSIVKTDDIVNLKFHDYHALRPYKKYKLYNDIILNMLIKSL
tara:strand:+ start:2403 stop:3200 length:798 start_codon:yes stop_codon:yes gene_type:complete